MNESVRYPPYRCCTAASRFTAEDVERAKRRWVAPKMFPMPLFLAISIACAIVEK